MHVIRSNNGLYWSNDGDKGDWRGIEDAIKYEHILDVPSVLPFCGKFTGLKLTSSGAYYLLPGGMRLATVVGLDTLSDV